MGSFFFVVLGVTFVDLMASCMPSPLGHSPEYQGHFAPEPRLAVIKAPGWPMGRESFEANTLLLGTSMTRLAPPSSRRCFGGQVAFLSERGHDHHMEIVPSTFTQEGQGFS